MQQIRGVLRPLADTGQRPRPRSMEERQEEKPANPKYVRVQPSAERRLMQAGTKQVSWIRE